ncbi:unnamed protein product [Cyprideis torosa]|uniref:thioredoxin-dependent peroxiredoxin n=1 Tax=Cyprideis torosa TaxID=163714 RepID=A0A7R8WIA5_9CRUS|nr:unnamed protein product [Cyprideis torosa]CAG0894478.1 unnamed protein product [Cyprideis torosa]
MLKIGDKAPILTQKDQNDNDITFPIPEKDNTPGCTSEACSIRDEYEDFIKKDIEIIGISKDSVKSHQKFIDKYSLPYTLISDEDLRVVDAYGVYGKKKMMGREYMGIFRTTYIVDSKGIITHIIDKVDTKNAAAQIKSLI